MVKADESDQGMFEEQLTFVVSDPRVIISPLARVRFSGQVEKIK